MALLPVTLFAEKDTWRFYHARQQNKRFVLIKNRVLERDNYTCRFCGFLAKEFQEVVNIDNNYKNNKMDNFATACCFCAQCFFLDAIGMYNNTGGVITYIPEISQADLNNFCRVLFCSLDKESAYKGRLQAVYMSLKDRTKEVVHCFGPDTSEPRVFAQGILDAGLNHVQLQNSVLRDLRLLPARKPFAAQIDYWKKTVFAKVPL